MDDTYVIGRIENIKYDDVILSVGENKLKMCIFNLPETLKEGDTIVVKVYTYYATHGYGSYEAKTTLDSKTYTKKLTGLVKYDRYCPVKKIECDSMNLMLCQSPLKEQTSDFEPQDEIEMVLEFDLKGNVVDYKYINNLTKKIIISPSSTKTQTNNTSINKDNIIWGTKPFRYTEMGCSYEGVYSLDNKALKLTKQPKTISDLVSVAQHISKLKRISVYLTDKTTDKEIMINKDTDTALIVAQLLQRGAR